MADVDLQAILPRLTPTARGVFEGAVELCRARENPYVEIAHWLRAAINEGSSDIARILSYFKVDPGRLETDVTAALQDLPRAASASPRLAVQIAELMAAGGGYADQIAGRYGIRSGDILAGALRNQQLRSDLLSVSSELRKVFVDVLVSDFDQVTHGSAEADAVVAGGEGAGAPETASGSALGKYAVDMTSAAREGKFDKIVGRDDEIRQVVDILLRRRQNNPILVGEAGVGKTAVVEGFARRIVDGDVPPSLREVTLWSLDVGLMQAGASMKGEFEKRLRSVIDEVENADTPIILFVDEAHTLIGAGGQAGTGDAANLLKPALARGRLRTIAATTYAEYKKHIEKDPALTRRFQTVDVAEPDTAKAITMLRSVVGVLEAHHEVTILDEAVEAAVKLSERYVPARQLPDKAVSLLDTACARVGVSQHATPAPVEAARRRIDLLEAERSAVAREVEQGFRSGDRVVELDAELTQARAHLESVDAKWRNEKTALGGVLSARVAASEAKADATTGMAPPSDLPARLEALRTAHGDDPMVFAQVDGDAVASVVADWTGIPMGRMVKDEVQQVLTVADSLKGRVIGQDHAMDAIAKRLQTTRAQLDNPNKPIGVFMLAGPSGVGKTETAHALAELMYGGDDSLIVINMSEFQEAHTVSTLKGAPPGYVGYGEGGVLTEAVRRRPYSVVLLDEIEKAHPDVHEMFFQVFDKGHMEDGEGRSINFTNTLILLTSNVGTDLIAASCEDPETAPLPDTLAHSLRPALLEVFPPALLGRLVVLPYYPLSKDMLGKIVQLQINKIQRRVQENHGAVFEYDPAVVQHVVERCTESASGGRMIDAILTNTMLPDLSKQILAKMIAEEPITRVQVGVENDAFAYQVS